MGVRLVKRNGGSIDDSLHILLHWQYFPYIYILVIITRFTIWLKGPQRHMHEIVPFGSFTTVPVVFKLIQCSCYVIVIM